MKKFLLTAGIICSLILSGVAQDNTEVQKADGSRIETLKIAYITQKLNLTTDEAEKFWPVYDKYMTEIRGARHIYQADKDELKLEENILNIRKKYSNDFSRALPAEKINLFFRSEKEFGAIVQKTLMERRQQRVQQRRQLLRQ